MLYMSDNAGKLKVVVLETANLDELRKGHPAKTPDNSILIAWTPDPVWLADRILSSSGDGPAIGRLIEEAAKRPQKPARPHHGPYEKKFVGKPSAPARTCTIVDGSVGHDKEAADDGAYDLFEASGTPAEIGQAIAASLETCDLFQGRDMSSYIEAGQPIFIRLCIRVQAVPPSEATEA